MGRIDRDDAVSTAKRYAKARKQQEKTSTGGAGFESAARAANRRRDFMAVSGRVFFESIIEGSDLIEGLTDLEFEGF